MITKKDNVIVINNDGAYNRDIKFGSYSYNESCIGRYSFNLNRIKDDDVCIFTNHIYLPVRNCEDNRAAKGSSLFFVNTPEYSMDKVRAAGYKVVYSVDRADYIVFSEKDFIRKFVNDKNFYVYLDTDTNIAYGDRSLFFTDNVPLKEYTCYYAKNCKAEMNSTIRAIVNDEADRIVLSQNINLDVNAPTEDMFLTIAEAIKSHANFEDISVLVNMFASTNWKKFPLSSFVIQKYIQQYTYKRVASFDFTKDAKGFLNENIDIYKICALRSDVSICQRLYRTMTNLNTTECTLDDFNDKTRTSEFLLKVIMPYCFNCSVQITDK